MVQRDQESRGKDTAATAPAEIQELVAQGVEFYPQMPTRRPSADEIDAFRNKINSQFFLKPSQRNLLEWGDKADFLMVFWKYSDGQNPGLLTRVQSHELLSDKGLLILTYEDMNPSNGQVKVKRAAISAVNLESLEVTLDMMR